jgi:hypothetical protein
MAAWITFALLNRHTVAMSFLALTTASVVFLWARRGRIPALRTLALGLSALLFALALQKTLDRVLQVRDVGQLSNLMAVDEVVGTVRFSNQPVSSFQNLATYRAVGAASFEQAIRDYSCGGLATYLMYFPGSPFDLRSLTQSSFALQDLPRLALTNPGGYLHHRACAAAAVLEMSSGELFYPYHTQIDPNRFGLRDRSMLPHVRSFVLGFLERASSYRKWMLLQIAFRHWLVLAASLAAAVYSFLGTVFKRLHSPERMMPAYLFACGCVVLLPFLIASGNDWRYLMPANICWVLGIAIAVQLRVNWPEHPPST